MYVAEVPGVTVGAKMPFATVGCVTMKMFGDHVYVYSADAGAEVKTGVTIKEFEGQIEVEPIGVSANSVAGLIVFTLKPMVL
jgi:hypothetical protein